MVSRGVLEFSRAIFCYLQWEALGVPVSVSKQQAHQHEGGGVGVVA